jgi:zinc transport system substrate-binding protein
MLFSGHWSSAETKQKNRILVSIPPLAYFIERIGGDFVEVKVLVQPGQSPETFEPTPKQMTEFSKVDVYIPIGLPFETVLTKKLHELIPESRIIHCLSEIVRNRLIYPISQSGKHQDHNHNHGELDPHVWLDPVISKQICKNICQILKDISPEWADYFDIKLQALIDDLDVVNHKIADQLKPYKGREFYVFHPAFGYFAKRYHLIQTAVEFEGKEPSAYRLTELIDRAKKGNIKTIFVQEQFSQKSARSIADAINGTVVPIDPLAPDYINNLLKIAKKLAEGFAR